MVIELKPNWDNAPEWAKYWTVDNDGKCWWFECMPGISDNDNYWTEPSPYGKTKADKTSCETWRESLEERPLKVITIKPTPTTCGDVRDFMTKGIETKLDSIAELLEKLVDND